MFRLLFLLFTGFIALVAAIAFLPIPGKTFFNKLSKLPKDIRNLIDDVLDISEEGMRLFVNLSQELNDRISKVVEQAKEKSHEYREKLHEEEKEEEIV